MLPNLMLDILILRIKQGWCQIEFPPCFLSELAAKELIEFVAMSVLLQVKVIFKFTFFYISIYVYLLFYITQRICRSVWA